jgi:hypothetical protein
MESLRLEPYDDAMFDAYASFARSQYGAHAYQATRRYLGWLYDENPASSKGRADFILCRQGRTVVGCIHKLRLRWRAKGETVEIPTLHNWMMAPEHRKGVGTLLLTGACRGESHALIPGAAGDLAAIYRQLRFEELPLSWYRRVLTPIRGGIRYLVTRGGKLRLFSPFRYDHWDGAPNGAHDEIIVEADPRPEVIETLAATARGGEDEAVRPEWTAESFRWRFFHPRGPRHLLLRHAGDPRSFLVLGAGDHRGLVAGRVVDVFYSSFEAFRALLRRAQSVLRRLGAHVMVIYSGDRRLDEMLSRVGLRPDSTRQAAFFFHGSPRQRFGTVGFRGSAIDFGLEAILTGRRGEELRSESA